MVITALVFMFLAGCMGYSFGYNDGYKKGSIHSGKAVMHYYERR